jgi:hypothetical protein
MTLDAEILRHSKWGPRAMRELRQAIRLHAHCRESVWILIAEGQRKKQGHNTTVRALHSRCFSIAGTGATKLTIQQLIGVSQPFSKKMFASRVSSARPHGARHSPQPVAAKRAGTALSEF